MNTIEVVVSIAWKSNRKDRARERGEGERGLEGGAKMLIYIEMDIIAIIFIIYFFAISPTLSIGCDCGLDNIRSIYQS